MWRCTCVRDAGARDDTTKKLKRLSKYRIETESCSTLRPTPPSWTTKSSYVMTVYVFRGKSSTDSERSHPRAHGEFLLKRQSASGITRDSASAAADIYAAPAR